MFPLCFVFVRIPNPIIDRQRQEQQQQQALIDNELEYRQAIIEERDEGIEAIQHSIGEVNEIFQDLAVLIDQQGGQIGAFETQAGCFGLSLSH